MPKVDALASKTDEGRSSLR